MDETVFGLGAVCVIAAIVGGGLQALGTNVPIIDSERRQVLLAVFGIVLMIIGGLIYIVERDTDDGTPPPAPTAAASATRVDPTQTESPTVTGTASANGSREAGCEITIANPLATLHEEPNTFSQEVGFIPAGTYAVAETRNVQFGPTTQRWMQITPVGRTGWVRDNTFNIASKTDACP